MEGTPSLSPGFSPETPRVADLPSPAVESPQSAQPIQESVQPAALPESSPSQSTIVERPAPVLERSPSKTAMITVEDLNQPQDAVELQTKIAGVFEREAERQQP